jgi:hypothetical protein
VVPQFGYAATAADERALEDIYQVLGLLPASMLASCFHAVYDSFLPATSRRQCQLATTVTLPPQSCASCLSPCRLSP